MKDEEPISEIYRREMFAHLENLRDRCSKLIENRDSINVFNQAQSLCSITGQLAAAARRWHELS
jgi:hypothetical protein